MHLFSGQISNHQGIRGKSFSCMNNTVPIKYAAPVPGNCDTGGKLAAQKTLSFVQACRFCGRPAEFKSSQLLNPDTIVNSLLSLPAVVQISLSESAEQCPSAKTILYFLCLLPGHAQRYSLYIELLMKLTEILLHSSGEYFLESTNTPNLLADLSLDTFRTKRGCGLSPSLIPHRYLVTP